MTTRANPVAAAVVLLAIPGYLAAQWPSRRSAAAPRTPDGKVNPEAPAPRTADGKPDLSGIWEFRNTPGVEATATQVTQPPPDAGTGLGPNQRFNPRLSQFFNIGTTVKDGLPFLPVAAELRQRRAAETYTRPDEWWRRSILNVAGMGKFSSDRSIEEYAKDIWRVSPVKVP